MSDAAQTEQRLARRRHLKRVLVGSAFGLIVGLLCPRLPPEAQIPCRVVVTFFHSLVNL